MGKLIKNEMERLLKSRKNKIFLLVLMLLVLITNIYYRQKQKNYIDELEKKTNILYNSAQIRIDKAVTEIQLFERQKKLDKMILIKDYGSLEKAEEKINLFKIELERNNKEASYVKNILLLQKQLQSKHGRNTEDESDILKQILDCKIRRIDNIIEADREGVLPESALKLRKVTMDDIRRNNIYYNYLAENDIKYNINPYTNTGVFSVVKLLENNAIFLIFLIFTFISIDLFLLEVEDGSYKVAYTQPYDRQKIFFSKIIAMLLFTIIVLFVVLGINFIANTILNGLGDFNEPFAVSKNISNISLNNKNIEFKIVSIGENIALSIILFLIAISFNIAFISFVSVFTDSTATTIGIEVSLIILCLLFREFVSPNSIMHAVSPLSYIFTQDILIEKYNTNYIFGIILNLGLAMIFLVVGSSKFIKKDFLGSKI